MAAERERGVQSTLFSGSAEGTESAVSLVSGGDTPVIPAWALWWRSGPRIEKQAFRLIGWMLPSLLQYQCMSALVTPRMAAAPHPACLPSSFFLCPYLSMAKPKTGGVGRHRPECEHSEHWTLPSG